MNHVTFVAPTRDLVRVDSFEWKGKVLTETFEHTKVLWKDSHILTIKKHIDYQPKVEVDDDDEDDTPPAQPMPNVKCLIHTNWDWIKHYYGEFSTLDEAKNESIKAVEEIARNIRRAFALRKPRSK